MIPNNHVNPYGFSVAKFSVFPPAATYFVADAVGVKVFDSQTVGAVLLKGHRRAVQCGLAAKIACILAVVCFAVLSATVSNESSLFKYHDDTSEDFDSQVKNFAFGNITLQSANFTYPAFGFQSKQLFMPAVCMQLLDPDEFALGKSVSRKALLAFMHTSTASAWNAPDLSLYQDAMRIALGLIGGTVLEIVIAVVEWRKFKQSSYLIRHSFSMLQILGLVIGFAIPALLGASLIMIVTNLPVAAFFYRPQMIGDVKKACTLKTSTDDIVNAQLLDVQPFATVMAALIAGAFLFLVCSIFVTLRHSSNIGAWKRDNNFKLTMFDKLSMKLCCCRSTVAPKM
eukprot:ANDGO_01353.mRNA.1 hypothetical protein